MDIVLMVLLAVVAILAIVEVMDWICHWIQSGCDDYAVDLIHEKGGKSE